MLNDEQGVHAVARMIPILTKQTENRVIQAVLDVLQRAGAYRYDGERGHMVFRAVRVNEYVFDRMLEERLDAL